MSEDFGDIIKAREQMREAYAAFNKLDNRKPSVALDAALREITLTNIVMERALSAHGLKSCFGIFPAEEAWTCKGRIQ